MSWYVLMRGRPAAPRRRDLSHLAPAPGLAVMDERDWLAERFQEPRPRRRAVAYRRLGSTGEADDAVQEAWIRLSRSDADAIENLEAWLVTTVGRVALHMLPSRRTGPRGFAGGPPAGPDRRQRGRRRPRARGPDRRLRRARAARRARDAVAGGAARLCPARHVRDPVRRDRRHRRPLPRGDAPARQPRAPPHPRRR